MTLLEEGPLRTSPPAGTLGVQAGEGPAGVAVLTLAGDLDLATVEVAERALSLVEAGSPRAIVIDLTRLDFLDSCGLRTILAADARARQAGRRLSLLRGPEQVQKVFRITRLDSWLQFEQDATGDASAR